MVVVVVVHLQEVLIVHENEHGTDPGELVLQSGNVTGGFDITLEVVVVWI